VVRRALLTRAGTALAVQVEHRAYGDDLSRAFWALALLTVALAWYAVRLVTGNQLGYLP